MEVPQSQCRCSAGAVYRRLWTSLCSCTDVVLRVQFLDQVDMPVTVQRQVRSLCDDVVGTPVVAQTQIPMVRFTTEILHLQYIDKVIDVVVQVRSSCAAVGNSRDPTVAARFFLDQVVDMPVVFNDRVLGVKVHKTVKVRCCSTSDKVVDDTVGAVHRQVMDVL